MMVNGCYYDGNARFLLSSRTAKMMHDFGHHQRGERAAVWIVAQSIEGKSLITEYLMQHANDPSSVELVSVDSIRADSVRVVSDTEEYQAQLEAHSFMCHEAEFSAEIGELKEAKDYLRRADSIMAEMDKAEAKFYPYLRGMMTTITYRAKNGYGALVLSKARVTFDKDMTKVTDFEDFK